MTTQRYSRDELLGLYKDYALPEPLHPPLIVLFDPTVVDLSGGAQRPLALAGTVLSSARTAPPLTTATEQSWFYTPNEGEAPVGPVCYDELVTYVEQGKISDAARVNLRGDSAKWELKALIQNMEQRKASKAPPPSTPSATPPVPTPQPKESRVPHFKTSSANPQWTEGNKQSQGPKPQSNNNKGGNNTNTNNNSNAQPSKTAPVDVSKVTPAQIQTFGSRPTANVSDAPSSGGADKKSGASAAAWRTGPVEQQPQPSKTFMPPPQVPPSPEKAPSPTAPSPNYVIPKQVGSAWAKPLQGAIKVGGEGGAGGVLSPKQPIAEEAFPALDAAPKEPPPPSNARGGYHNNNQQASVKKTDGGGRGGRGGKQGRGGKVESGLLNFNLPDPSRPMQNDE